MTIGPGKYDEICSVVRQATEAQAAIVIILGGNLGNGFSCQCPATLLERLPEMLRRVATQLETDQKRIN